MYYMIHWRITNKLVFADDVQTIPKVNKTKHEPGVASNQQEKE